MLNEIELNCIFYILCNDRSIFKYSIPYLKEYQSIKSNLIRNEKLNINKNKYSIEFFQKKQKRKEIFKLQ